MSSRAFPQISAACGVQKQNLIIIATKKYPPGEFADQKLQNTANVSNDANISCKNTEKN